MVNSRPSRPRASKPTYNSSTPSTTDSDRLMGKSEKPATEQHFFHKSNQQYGRELDQEQHAKHSAIREALEHVGDKLKQHRENVEAERERKAKANLESERSLEEKRKIQAQQNLAHENKLAEIKNLEDEAKRLRGQRFSASLLGRTLAVAGKTGKAIGRGTVAGSKLAYKVGKGGYEAIERINGTSRRTYVRRTYTQKSHARKHKRKRSSTKSSGEQFLFG